MPPRGEACNHGMQTKPLPSRKPRRHMADQKLHITCLDLDASVKLHVDRYFENGRTGRLEDLGPRPALSGLHFPNVTVSKGLGFRV